MTYAHDLQRRIELKRMLGKQIDELISEEARQVRAGAFVHALNRNLRLSRATAFIKTGNKVI